MFHPKPGHVSDIRKGRHIHLSQTALRQKCLLDLMSHFTLILKSLLWAFLCLNLAVFLLWMYFLISQVVSITFAFSTLLNAARFLGPVTVTCSLQSPFHQKDVGNVKYCAKFLLTRYCTFSQ